MYFCLCIRVRIYVLYIHIGPRSSKPFENQIHGLVKPKLRLSTDQQRIPSSPPPSPLPHPKSWIEQMVLYNISLVSIWWLLQLLSSAEFNVKKLRMVPQYYPSIIWARTSFTHSLKHTYIHHAPHSSFIGDQINKISAHAADNKIHTWMAAAASAQRYNII